jgi:hypothetical protein
MKMVTVRWILNPMVCLKNLAWMSNLMSYGQPTWQEAKFTIKKTPL